MVLARSDYKRLINSWHASEIQAKLDFLRSVPVLSSVTDNQLRLLSYEWESRDIEPGVHYISWLASEGTVFFGFNALIAGGYVYQQASKSTGLFLLEKGEVTLRQKVDFVTTNPVASRESSRQSQVLDLGILGRGEFFGEIETTRGKLPHRSYTDDSCADEAFAGMPRAHSARAHTAVKVLHLPASAILEKLPEVALEAICNYSRVRTFWRNQVGHLPAIRLPQSLTSWESVCSSF